uniref:C-type lectin domain family 4 member A n=1 Tax=Ovis aries TaxID=9940 RepID=A0AC11DUR7_SHEEP
MTSEVTYAEVKFNKPKSSGTKSEPPAAPKETNLHQSGHSFSKLLLTSLLILLLLLAVSFLIAFLFYFQKCSYVHQEEKATRELTHTELECVKENSTPEGFHHPETGNSLCLLYGPVRQDIANGRKTLAMG